MPAPTAPNLPFPVFQVSQKVERYLLYDISVITWLRKNHNILGVLIGSLPQIPQQNVFLGLPLELQPEEARLLVESGLAYIVNDLKWHAKDLASKTAEQKESIRTDLRQEGAKIAKDFESNKKSRTQKALKRIQEKQPPTPNTQHPDAIPKAPRENEDNAEETSLSHNPLTREKTTTTTPPNPSPSTNPNPWTLTPTTSNPLLLPSPPPPPPTSNTASLPKVTSSSSSYALFKHLHTLGYYLTPGIRFGCQFSVYPGDPLRFHSHFLAMSAGWDEEVDLLDLVGGGRLGTGVKKGWLVGGIEGAGEEGDAGGGGGGGVRTFCVEWGGM